jgi:hypothetical protein
MLHSSNQILKTIFNEKESAPDHLKDNVQQLIQTNSTDAAVNLLRRTGDMAVYGMRAFLTIYAEAYDL